jgi:UPF0755 protein
MQKALRRGLALVLPFLIFFTAAGVLRAWTQNILLEPGPLAAASDVVVPRGDRSRVSAALEQAGVIASPWRFALAVWVTSKEGPLHAGEFSFPPHATPRDVLTVLRTAHPVQHRLTIPEGLTARQITALFAGADAASGDTPPIAEGTVLPETYNYERDTPRATLLARATAAFARLLAQDWQARAPESAPLATPADAVTLASIVERETARADERPHVAAVYLNRLRAGMKLQADPTVVYAVSDGAGTLDHPLTRADLDTDSPFNTYRNAGLPPGPICAPGAASIEAVLHPAASDDLYFVADGSGGHAFARTLQEHQRNVARWRALTPPTPAHAG